MAAKNMAPYKIKKRGQMFVVVNNANEVKGTHPTKDAAIAQMRALYASVPGAGKAADRKPWTGKQKRAVKAAADDESNELDPAYDPGVMAAAVDALIDTVLDMLEDVDESTLTPELKQIRDLLYAGDPIVDRLLKLLGVVDPDDVPESMFSQVPQAQDAADSSKPYGDVQYADPGYQKDKKKRYPIDTADHVRSAWSYINQPGNAAKYSPADRAKIKARITAAAKRLGVDIAAEKAAQDERLQRQYGPRQIAVGPLGAGMVEAKPDGKEDPEPPTQAEEDGEISKSANSPAAKLPHPFMPAVWPNKAGHPRCRLCGQDTAMHADFHPEQPVAAADLGALPLQHFNGGTITVPSLQTTQLLVNSSSTSANSTAPATTQSRQPLKEGEAPQIETVKAFVTEVNGKTLITGQASAFNVEKALAGNEHMLWMQGRFVGAEKANRNGAFWKTEDLEMGQPSVNHGPLNWLHETKHVIGTIADSRLVLRNEQANAELDQPYLEATSAIWKWVYPDEAWVVEQASDAGKLWYSMECISKEVACVGDGGCGARASYGDYIQGKGTTCAHMTERSATRHFASPTFLGGAVIVPPVRPGWAEADATVLRQAAGLAERAYDQAGKPDVPASEWEQMMAQILRYAGA